MYKITCKEKNYFIFLIFILDAKEIVRQELHMALREACAKGDVSRAKAILSSLDGDSESIINSAPSGSCTLLYR